MIEEQIISTEEADLKTRVMISSLKLLLNVSLLSTCFGARYETKDSPEKDGDAISAFPEMILLVAKVLFGVPLILI